jgi:3-dehydroquinate dehydratase/shikimate dehydrogenase
LIHHGKITLFASMEDPFTAEGLELTGIPGAVACLEIRADCVGDVPAQWISDRFPGRLLYTLRTKDAGGKFQGTVEERARRIRWAAKFFDFVDLEAPDDLISDLLSTVNPKQRIISSVDVVADQVSLRTAFVRHSNVDAVLHRVISHTTGIADEASTLQFQFATRRSDTAVYSATGAGSWTRLTSALLGAAVIFAPLTASTRPDEGLTIGALLSDYGLPTLTGVRDIFGIVSPNPFRSLSPRLHNIAHKRIGSSALYLPFKVDSLSTFWDAVVNGSAFEKCGFLFRGITVTAPHKEDVLTITQDCTANALGGRSGNNLSLVVGGWRADTTDPDGVLRSLAERDVRVRGRKTAVVGCGGAGRSIAARLKTMGVDVTLVNRGFERGIRAAQLLDLPWILLSVFDPREFSMIINATPMGLENDTVPSFNLHIPKAAVVVNLSYGSHPNPFVMAVKPRCEVVVDGLEVLLFQALRQFQLMTGREISLPDAREILGLPI